jgi:hypothetical protein
MCRAFAQNLVTAMHRGMPLANANRMMLAVWVLGRVVRTERVVSKGVYERTDIILPFYGINLPMRLGGVGRLPYTPLGSNVDLFISMIDNSSFMQELNIAAGFFDAKKPNYVRKVASALIDRRSGPLRKGVEFANKHLLRDRILRAEEAGQRLASRNIYPAITFYNNMSYELVHGMIQSSPNLRSIRRREQYTWYERMAYKDAPRDYMAEVFSWRSVVRFVQLDETIDRVHPCAHMVGLDPQLRNILMRYGISVDSSSERMDSRRIFAPLFEDPHFNRNITVDYLIQVFSDPTILSSTDNIVDVLLAMGAELSKATLVAGNIRGSLHTFYINSAMAGFSVNDSFLREIDFSLGNITRCVDEPMVIDAQVVRILRLAAFIWGILQPVNGRRVRVEVFGSGAIMMMEKIMPGLRSELMRYHNMYPDAWL